LVRDYLRKINVDDRRLESIVGASDSILPAFPAERIFDVAFIDGGHAFPYPVIDWHYMTRLLKVGGKLIVDDIPIPSIACVFRFMQSDPSWRLDRILDERAAVLTLIDEPHYGDYVLQAFNSNFDYGFIPLPSRLRLILPSRISRLRQQIGLRYPTLRQAWRRFSHASNSR
jgi:Methyltransferase domain